MVAPEAQITTKSMRRWKSSERQWNVSSHPTKKNKQTHINMSGMREIGTLTHCRWENNTAQPLWGNTPAQPFLRKSKSPHVTQQFHPEASAREKGNRSLTQTYKRWKLPPSTGGWVTSITGSIQARAHRSAHIRMGTWMDLKNVTPRARSQTPKATQCAIPSMWDVQDGHSHGDRKWVRVVKGGGVGDDGVFIWGTKMELASEGVPRGGHTQTHCIVR